jgi:hypothetical protein
MPGLRARLRLRERPLWAIVKARVNAAVHAAFAVKTENTRNAVLIVLHPPFRCTSRLNSRFAMQYSTRFR